MHDLVVRGGTVFDGTGADGRVADVAVTDGVVTEVGRVEGPAAREVDADGAIVTPGFVDVHSHYDGQATWDSLLAPSSWHGVTTVVNGNCGVGFAPVRRQDRQQLIELMEGVEDIPGAALHEGLAWDWETFGEYLDALERRPHDIDLAAQVPHGALRLYVMGQRGADREDATPEEVDEMGRLAAEAVQAGALGFTTSRTRNHRTSRGDFTPTLTAAAEELWGIAEALGVAGRGVLEVVTDGIGSAEEQANLFGMVERSGRPLSVSLTQFDAQPQAWRVMLDAIADANRRGLPVTAQVPARPIGVLLGLQATINPLASTAAFEPLRDLPLPAQVEALRRPEVRAAVLQELGAGPTWSSWDKLFLLGDPPDYEPGPEKTVSALAAAAGATPAEVAYDALLADDGRAFLYLPFLNYSDGNLDAAREMLTHESSVLGLADGGAHVGTICDASFPTTMLTHWARDRRRGPGIDLAYVVANQTSSTAAMVGLHDRGVLTPGMKADLNVIDFDNLRLGTPTMAFDLPAGGKRLLQRADGYLHTFVAGVETYASGEHTGQLPGRLVRGAQPAPSA